MSTSYCSVILIIFLAEELHRHVVNWAEIAKMVPSSNQEGVPSWIDNRVSTSPYFRHFKGTFEGEHYDSDRPTHKISKSCRANNLEILLGERS